MAGLLNKGPLSPIVTGSALLLLLKGPSSVREPALQQLGRLLKPQNIDNLVTALKWIFAIGLVQNATAILNAWAGNNFSVKSTKKSWNWEKEIAVVTGGSSGFGALFTHDLVAHGVHVVNLDVNEPPEHLKNNPKVSFFKCDVTDADAVNDVAKTIQDSIGHPSILINNAGIGSEKRIIDCSPQFLKKIVGVNLLSHFYTVSAFMPDMITKKKGHIITIASMASFFTNPTIVDYSCTKVGALAFHEGLSSELRAIHKCPEIRTTIVHPIWAATPLIQASVDRLRKSGQLVLDPQDVSDAVVDQIINVRGGQIIIAGKMGGVMRAFRGLPYWLQEALRRLIEMTLPTQ